MPERLLTRARLERSRRYPAGTRFDSDGRPILPTEGEGNSYEVADDELGDRMCAAVYGEGGWD